MHPKVNEVYQEFSAKYEMQGPFLEVGAGDNENAILAGAYFAGKRDRFAINLSDMEMPDDPDGNQIKFIRCNSNNMRDAFADGQFGTVLCNAMIEHDKYFWRSLDEMKRVLAPGGILAIGAPGYVARKHLPDGVVTEKLPKATITLDLHSAPDYWRFSRMAFKDVICEGLELLDMTVALRVPILIAVARKPLSGLLEPVPQLGRSAEQKLEDEIKWQTRARKASPDKLAARRASQLEKREARLKDGKGKQDGAVPGETPEERRQRLQAKKAARAAKLQAKGAKRTVKEADEEG